MAPRDLLDTGDKVEEKTVENGIGPVDPNV